MKITVCCPVLNEISCIKAWYFCVEKFADEVIVIDTGSTDGTFEWLYDQISVDIRSWEFIRNRYEWPEHKIRNKLIEMASGDFIVPLDADELVGDDFINSLNGLGQAKIHRYLQIAPWGSLNTVRPRKIRPLVEKIDGKRRWLRNWRGQYPMYTPRAFRRDDRIRYSETGNHCMLEYRKMGHLTYHLPITKTHKDIPFYHYHYLYKNTNIRDKEKPDNLIEINVEHPKELTFYDKSLCTIPKS